MQFDDPLGLTRPSQGTAQRFMSSTPPGAPRATQKPKEEKKKKGGWTAWLSELSGAGGAGVGAAIGTAVAPGLGTLIGGGLGGLIGGFGGKTAEQRIRDPEESIGTTLRKATGEGAIEGIFGAGPLRLGRVGLAAAKGLKAGGKETAKEAAQVAATKPGLLSRVGSTLRGEARGVDAGTRLSGQRIGPQRVNEINQFIESVIKPKGATAAKQLEGVESFIQNQTGELSSAITKSNRKLSAADRKSIVNAFQSQFGRGVVGVTDRQKGIAADLMERVKQAKDIKSLDDLRKVVDDNINFARNAASPEPQAEQVFKMFRKILTDDVANKVGAAKSLKSNLKNAFDAEELLLNKASQRGSSFSPAGITAPARGAQAAQSLMGRVAGRTGQVFEPTTAPGVAGSTMARTLLGKGVGAAMTPPDTGEELPGTDIGAMTDVSGQPGAMAPSGEAGAMGQGGMGQAAPQSPFQDPAWVQQAYMSALQQGDTQTAQAILKGYEMFGSTEAGAELTSDQQKEMGKLQSLEASTAELLQQFQSAGGGQGVVGVGRELLGKVPGVQEDVKVYEQMRQSLIGPIARVISGEVGVLTDKDIKRAEGILPKVGDSPGEAQQKIANLRSLIEARRGAIGSSPAGISTNNLEGLGGTDILQTLQQAGGF